MAQITIYHQCERDDPGDFQIIRWNILPDSLPETFVMEKVDAMGRVEELKFFYKGSLNYNVECGVYTWVQYEYPNDTTIIETLLNGSGKRASNIECGAPSKATYYLSQDQRSIINEKFENYVDTAFYLNHGMTMEEITNALNQLELEMEKTETDCVRYYSESKAKLNGIYPISKYFVLKYYFMSESERSEISNAIEKK